MVNTMKSVYGDPKTAEGTTEADSSKKVLDLVDIYETNPGLQRIRKIKKQPQHPKRIILKDTCNHKVLKRVKRKTARRSNSLPRNRNNSVPLPPKNKTLLKRKLTPRDVTKRRFKREEVSFGNREDGTNIDPLKEKGDFPKSQRRYMKSEFDVFTELDKMKITDMTVVLSAPSVSTTSQNIDEENVSYISQGGQPKNSLGTECAAEKWNKSFCRTERIHKLFRKINRCRRSEAGTSIRPLYLSRPLGRSPKIDMIEIGSDEG